MIDGTQVQADGVEIEPGTPRSSSPFLPFVLIMILVLGFVAISVARPDSEPVSVAETDSPLERPADLRDAELGIGEVITGFQDALVGIAEAPEGSVVHLLWPNSRPVVTRETSDGTDIAFDRSGVFMATTSILPGRSGQSLVAGRVNSLDPIAESVTSFAWHDGVAGLLGYVVDRGDRWEIWRVNSGFAGSLEIEGGTPTPELVAWGEWGYALQHGAEITLFTKDGDHKAGYQGQVLTSRGDGWLLVAGETVDLLSAGGGVVRLPFQPDRVGLIKSASFSPDGKSVAVVGSEGILVSPIGDGGETIEFAVSDASEAIWSAEARFLIVPRLEGISIFDLRSVNQYSLLEDHEFRSVGIIAIGDS